MRHLIDVVEVLGARGVELVVLHQGIDTTSPCGRLLFHVLAVSEFATKTSRGSRPTCVATSTCTGTTRSSSPTWPGPAARYATLMPATTTKTADRRSTGAELPTSRRAVPDVPAA